MDFVQQYWYWVLLAVASGGFLIFDLLRSVGDKSLITPLDATLMINREDAVVIDVRDQGEYTQGHIPSSRHIPLNDLPGRQPELEKLLRDAPLILCCATGVRSGGAARQMRKAGLDKVFNLRGGLQEWERAGLPITTGRKSKTEKSAKEKGKEKAK